MLCTLVIILIINVKFDIYYHNQNQQKNSVIIKHLQNAVIITNNIVTHM